MVHAATASPETRIAEAMTALKKLVASNPTPQAFYDSWLSQLRTLCEADGGQLRRPAATGTLAITISHAFPTASQSAEPNDSVGAVASRYEKIVFDVFSTSRPTVVPPCAELGDHDDANPTAGVLFLVPLVLDGETRGVVELVLRAVPAKDELRILLNGIAAASSAAADYERLRVKHAQRAREALVDEIERFTRTVHEKLSSQHVAYAAANDGRRLIEADRVSVLIRRGRRWELTAVSGLQVVETRSAAAKALAELATVVASTGEPVWFSGDATSFAPQVRDALAAYIDQAHVRRIGIVPLTPQLERTATAEQLQALGAIVVEQFDDSRTDEAFGVSVCEERAKLVAQHTTAALRNAFAHETIPLLPLWRSVGALKQLFAPGTRIKSIAMLTLLVAFTAALKFVPADLALSARGTLQPVERRHCFAPLDGTVHTVHVRHGQRVVVGQLLLELRNTDLDVSLADTLGKRAGAADQLLSVERALFEDGSKLSAAERHRLAGQRSELKQELVSFDEQLRLLRRKRELLKITSPIAGEITTWNVDQLLANRPVRQGQSLLDVADTAGDWELELQVPEDEIAHLLRAQAAQGRNLAVSYRLAADPDVDRSASVEEVHYAAEVRGDEGNTVLVRASLAVGDLPPLRPGAEASTKVYCGKRALGYVWLHDAIDFVHSKVLFRMY